MAITPAIRRTTFFAAANLKDTKSSLSFGRLRAASLALFASHSMKTVHDIERDL